MKDNTILPIIFTVALSIGITLFTFFHLNHLFQYLTKAGDPGRDDSIFSLSR